MRRPKKFAPLLFIFLFFLLSQSIFAQDTQDILSGSIIGSVDKMKPGESYPVAVEIEIHQPYHINSNQPTEDYLIPTTLDLKTPEGITVGRIKYPAAEMKTFAFSEQPLSVYTGKVYIFTTLTLSPDFAQNEIPLEGTLGYQACDDQTCQAPADLLIKQKLPVAAAGEAVSPVNQEIFSAQQTAQIEEQPTAEEGSFARTVEERGLLLTFVFVFLMGLALNLTPCVYPLIPITISYFGGQAEGKKGSLVTHAILYVLGMAITYSILGVIAALTGSLFGAALQNPIVLIVIAVILVGLALSMFDLYEIRVPAFLSNFAGGSKQGFFGTFFMGLTVGIVAAPCIGPFVLALLTYVGGKGDVVLGFWLFFVLALGLGLPFLFLGLFSGSINKLPRSGAWMIWVRNIFGFILIAMAIYFLQPLFPNTLLYYLAMALTMLIGGIYMAWIEGTTGTGKAFPVVRNLVGIIFFAVALFLASTGIQSYIDESLAENRIAAGNVTSENAIQWFTFDHSKLAEAAAAGKPVMIDFYADWCIPCKELEKFTFSAPQVVETSRSFVMLKMDLTTADDPLAKELKSSFKIKGVPTLVFLTPDGQEVKESRIVGFVETEKFLPVMQKVLEKSNQTKLSAVQ